VTQKSQKKSQKKSTCTGNVAGSGVVEEKKQVRKKHKTSQRLFWVF
jgi:hypothetical protein